MTPLPTTMPSCTGAPTDAYSLFGRGLARYLKGDRPGGDRDIAAARATKSDIDDHMVKLGLRPQDFQ